MASRRGTDNSVRVAISGTLPSGTWANVFWAQLTTSGTPSQTDLDSWTTAFQSAYKTQLGQFSQTTVPYVQATAGLFLPASGFLASLITMTGAGTGLAGASVPNSSSLILSWLTGVYWRGGKPRTYLPLPPASMIEFSHDVPAATRTTLVTQGNAFRTAVNALTAGAITGTQLGLMSFSSGGAPRAVPVFYAFTGVKAHGRLGTQRRRLGKWIV